MTFRHILPRGHQTRESLVPFVVLTTLLLAAGPATSQGLDIALELTPNPLAPDQPLQMKATIGNSGALDAPAVTVEGVVPEGLDPFAEGVSDGADCGASNDFTCNPGDTIVWDLGTVPAGETRILTIAPAVADGASDIDFDLAVLSGGSEADSDQISAAALADPPLTLRLSEDLDPVGSEEQFTYTATFGRTATASIGFGAQLIFTLPAQTTFVSASDGGALQGNTVTWALGDLTPGDSGVRTVTVSSNAALPDGTLLGAAARVVAAAERADAEAVTTVGSTEIDVAIELNPDAISGDRHLFMAVTVSNRAALALQEVVIRGRLPIGLQSFQEGLTDGADCGATNDFTCNPGDTIVWTLGPIPAGAARRVSIAPEVATGLPDASLIEFELSALDGTGNIQTQTAQTAIVEAQPIFDLRLAANRDPVTAGGELEYLLTFGHVGAGVLAENVELRMALPPGASFVSASDGGTESNGVVTWVLGNQLPGENGVRRLVVTSDPLAGNGALIQAQAQIDATSTPSRGLARLATRISDTSDLGLALELVPDPVVPDELMQLRIVTTNRRATPLFDVTIFGRLPDGIQGFSEGLAESADCGATNDFTCNPGDTIVWVFEQIPPGGARAISVSIPAGDPLLDGQLIEFALAAQDSDDVNGVDLLTRAATTTVAEAVPIFELRLEDDLDPVAPAERLTYTATFGHVNTGDVAAQSELRIRVPEGTIFAEASDGGTEADGVVTWPLGDLTPGDSGTRWLAVDVDGAAEDGALILAEAELADADGGRSRAEAITRVAAESELATGQDELGIRPGESHVTADEGEPRAGLHRDDPPRREVDPARWRAAQKPEGLGRRDRKNRRHSCPRSRARRRCRSEAYRRSRDRDCQRDRSPPRGRTDTPAGFRRKKSAPTPPPFVTVDRSVPSIDETSPPVTRTSTRSKGSVAT